MAEKQRRKGAMRRAGKNGTEPQTVLGADELG
jgi:hypothetical protein